MLIHEKLQKEKFSDSQKAVADFILANPTALSSMTIREIARASYTSNATLIRIAHKLGFAGWEEFKDAYLKEYEYLSTHFSSIDPNIPFTKRDSVKSIMHKVAELKKEAIADTYHLLDPSSLLKAVQIMKEAREVHIMALNNTEYLAGLFALKLGRIGKKASAPSLYGESKYNGIFKEKDSCAVALSYSGETGILLDHMKEAREAGVKLIVITSVGESSAARMADVVLRICTREKMYSKISWFTTEAAFDYVLDLLYSILFWQEYEKNLEFKLAASRSLESKRSSSSSIIQEEDV